MRRDNRSTESQWRRAQAVWKTVFTIQKHQTKAMFEARGRTALWLTLVKKTRLYDCLYTRLEAHCSILVFNFTEVFEICSDQYWNHRRVQCYQQIHPIAKSSFCCLRKKTHSAKLITDCLLDYLIFIRSEPNQRLTFSEIKICSDLHLGIQITETTIYTHASRPISLQHNVAETVLSLSTR